MGPHLVTLQPYRFLSEALAYFESVEALSTGNGTARADSTNGQINYTTNYNPAPGSIPGWGISSDHGIINAT
jgi:hypothetical protein